MGIRAVMCVGDQGKSPYALHDYHLQTEGLYALAAASSSTVLSQTVGPLCSGLSVTRDSHLSGLNTTGHMLQRLSPELDVVLWMSCS